MTKLIFSLLVFYSLTACGTSRHSPSPLKISAADSITVQKLYAHYNEWRGVKYLEGGQSKSGIDCSGFVQLAYRHKLNKNIPRSTELMSNTGNTVNKKNLRPGDVIFFRTGWKKRHVGIYIGKNEFIHASSSRGVIKSNLSNPYWSDAYWMSRRY